jgi:hypothetical protein
VFVRHALIMQARTAFTSRTIGVRISEREKGRSEADRPFLTWQRSLINLQRDQRSGQTGTGAIEKDAHAQCFAALGGNQPHLTPDVIRMVEQRDLCLIECGVAFEACNPLFDGLAESGAYLEAILNRAIVLHGQLLEESETASNACTARPHVPLYSADSSEDGVSLPDYGVAAHR